MWCQMMLLKMGSRSKPQRDTLERERLERERMKKEATTKKERLEEVEALRFQQAQVEENKRKQKNNKY
jgi:hypothetical protein